MKSYAVNTGDLLSSPLAKSGFNDYGLILTHSAGILKLDDGSGFIRRYVAPLR
jgi:hypothetical protein